MQLPSAFDSRAMPVTRSWKLCRVERSDLTGLHGVFKWSVL
jgi:hypothetical protein